MNITRSLPVRESSKETYCTVVLSYMKIAVKTVLYEPVPRQLLYNLTQETSLFSVCFPPLFGIVLAYCLKQYLKQTFNWIELWKHYANLSPHSEGSAKTSYQWHFFKVTFLCIPALHKRQCRLYKTVPHINVTSNNMPVFWVCV